MQKQHEIKVIYADKKQAACVRTGNNAAWPCKCGRKIPLVGYSDKIDSQREYSMVECPDCKSIYRVVGPGLKRVPTHVQELPPPAVPIE